PTGSSEVSSARIIQDMDTLIRNKAVTQISKESNTFHLDPSFGSFRAPGLWVRYRWIILGTMIAFLILLFLFFLAKRRNKQGNNCVIFVFTLVPVDLGLDIAFLIMHGKDLMWLYPASLIFLVVPIFLNSIFTFFIISGELSINNGFAKWWQQYSKTALVFIFISGLDSDILNFIASKVAGISAFNAPFLWKTKKAVCFWNLFILIIEDISQFIILLFTIVIFIINIYSNDKSKRLKKKSKDDLPEPTNLHHANEEIVIDNDDDEISGTPFPSHLNFSRKTSTSHHQKHKTASSMLDYYRTEEYTNDNGGGGTGDRSSPTFYNNLTEENHFYRQRQNVHSLFSSVGKRGSSPETEISESVMLATNAVGEPVFSLRNPEEYRGPEVVQRSLKGKLVEDSIINIEDSLFEDMSSNEAGGSGVIGDVYGGVYGDAYGEVYGDAYGEVYEDAYGEVYGDGGRNSTSSNRLSNTGVIGNTEELLPEKENGTTFSESELEENIAAFADFDFGGIYPQTDINIGIESDTFNRSRDMELDSTTVRSSQTINTQIGSSEDNEERDG
ncbi:26074_t:CDS:2, partial [Gigaspora rosea]